MTPTRPRIATAVLAAAAALLTVNVAAAQADVTFARNGSELQVTGDAAANLITVDRDAAGSLRVDVGNDGTFEENSGASTVANTSRIVVDAGGGDDNVALSEVNGALPAATLN